MTLQDTDPSPHTAQCSVTGKMVPEDELVTFQGQRVCAEGKAILLDRLQAGEGIPGEFKRPTVLRRFACIFLDGLIIGVPFVIASQVVVTMSSPAMGGAVSLLAVIAQIVYFGQLHGSSGQSVGKKAGKLMVVNLDGSKISMQSAYVRAVAYAGPGVLTSIATLLGSLPLVGVASGIVGLYSISNTLVALFDSKRQRAIHDRIAGTRVIDRS